MDGKLLAVAVLAAVFFGLVIGGMIGGMQARETGMIEASTGVAQSIASNPLPCCPDEPHFL